MLTLAASGENPMLVQAFWFLSQHWCRVQHLLWLKPHTTALHKIKTIGLLSCIYLFFFPICEQNKLVVSLHIYYKHIHFNADDSPQNLISFKHQSYIYSSGFLLQGFKVVGE